MTPELFWLDLETTGLDPNKCSILECVVARATLLDPFNLTWVYSGVTWVHPEVVKDFDPFIVEMHTKNGLFKECTDEAKGLDTWEIEKALLDIVPDVADKEEKPILAGSSIHFDASFIKVHMPKLAKRFSHRYYDVSALKLFCQSQGMPKFRKAEAHRARADIEESVAHARECAAWLRGQRLGDVDATCK